MFASTSHQPFRAGTFRTEDGCRIPRRRPSRPVQRREWQAEQFGGRR